MTDSFVRGAISNVFSVWDDQGRFDEDGQKNLLDYLYQQGCVSSFFVRSGMGQMYAYEYDDVKKMAALACKHMAGKGPVIVGTTGIWDHNFDQRPDPKVFTQQAVELSQFAEAQGATATVHTLPEAIAPKDGETYADVTLRYFETISAATKKAIVLYQPPTTRAEYCVTMDLAAKLARIPRITAMKVSTNDAQTIFNLCYAMVPRGFGFIAGCETAFLAALCAGSCGCIGQGCAVNPVTIKVIQDRYEAGDREGAIEAQRSTNLLVEKGVATVEWFKRYVTERGFPVSTYARDMGRNPYMSAPQPLTKDQYEEFKRVLESELLKFETVPPKR